MDEPPHLIVDSDAAKICSLFDPSPLDFQRQFPDNPVLAAARGSAVLRTAFTQELLAHSGLSQLVLLGAGLDTRSAAGFAGGVWLVDRPEVLSWRRDLCGRADVVDVGIPVPLDVPNSGLLAALVDAGLAPELPTAVVALGLSMYLSADQNRALLSDLALHDLALAQGSMLIADVVLPDAEADATGLAYVQAIRAELGDREPWLSRFSNAEWRDLLAACGWQQVESRPEAHHVPNRFWQRQPWLRPMRLVELVAAVRSS